MRPKKKGTKEERKWTPGVEKRHAEMVWGRAAGETFESILVCCYVKILLSIRGKLISQAK